MKKLVIGALAGAALTALVSGSFAVAQGGGDSRRFSAQLDGWQEVPSQVRQSDGRFRARVVREGGAWTIRYVLRYEDLEGDAAAAHIHIASRHENGGVSAFLCGGGDKPACPAREGRVGGVIDAADVVGPEDQGVAPGEIEDLIRAMRRGETYANVHTSVAPGGEIRGQIRRSHN
jgi:CHRD domain